MNAELKSAKQFCLTHNSLHQVLHVFSETAATDLSDAVRLDVRPKVVQPARDQVLQLALEVEAAVVQPDTSCAPGTNCKRLLSLQQVTDTFQEWNAEQGG